MKINKVVLSKSEADWFSRNVLKTKSILEARSKKEPDALKRKTYKVLASLEEQASQMSEIVKQLGAEPYEVELVVKPKQKTVIAAMIYLTIQSLEKKILPEYQKRGLQDYIKDAEMKIDLLKAMGKKFR